MILMLKRRSQIRSDFYVDGIQELEIHEGFFIEDSENVYWLNTGRHADNPFYDQLVEKAVDLYDYVFCSNSFEKSSVTDKNGNTINGYYAAVIEYRVGDVTHNLIFDETARVYLCNDQGKTIDIFNL